MSLAQEIIAKEGWNEGEAERPRAASKKEMCPVREQVSYRSFPTQHLPSPAREYVEESAAAIGVDPGLVAPHVLAVMAGAIGNSLVLRLKNSHTEPAILWALTVAQSGDRKSPAWDAAVGPYRELEREARESCRETRYLAADITVQKAGRLLRENPRGLLGAREELDGWFSNLTRFREKGSDRASWIELYGGRGITIDRVGEKETIFVYRANYSLCGTIQPGVLAKASDTDAIESGLIARFLLAGPPARSHRWNEDEVTDKVRAAYKDLLKELRSLPFEKDPRMLSFSPAGKKRWVEGYDSRRPRLEASTGAQRALLSKLEGTAARLALIHQAATDTGKGRMVGDVDEAAIEAAYGLVDWFGDEGLRLYGQLHENDSERQQRQLIQTLREHGGAITVRDLMRSNQYHWRTAEMARSALESLVQAGQARWIQSPIPEKGGRRVEVLKLAEMTDDTCDTCSRGSFGSEPDTIRDSSDGLD